jgi:hypothetical protein
MKTAISTECGSGTTVLSEMYPPDLTQLQTQWSGEAGFPPQSSEASSQHESAVEQVSLAASQRITQDAQSASTISDMILFSRFTFDKYDRTRTDRQSYLSLDKAHASS